MPSGLAPKAILAIALSSTSAPSLAMDVKVRVDNSATISASNNPFLSTASHVEAMFLEITTEPRLTVRDETTQVDLSARLAHRRYSRLYGADTYGNTRIAGTSRRSELLDLSGEASLSYDSTSEGVDDISGAIDPQGVRLRAETSLAATFKLSEVATLSPTLQATKTAYRDSEALSGFSSFGTGLGYSRKLSSRTSAGLGVAGAWQRYEVGGRSAVFALLATGQTTLDEFTTLSGALGLERVAVTEPGTSSKPRMPLSGNVNLCRRRLKMTLCAVASARSDATGLGSLQRRISAGLTFTHQPAERTNYVLGADYQRSSSLGESSFGTLNYFAARASVDHQLSKVLTLTGYSTYRMRSGAGNVSAVSVGAGLRLKTGRP